MSDLEQTAKVKHNGPRHAGYPYRNLVIPNYMVDAVRTALIDQAGRIGIFNPREAERLRLLAQQL